MKLDVLPDLAVPNERNNGRVYAKHLPKLSVAPVKHLPDFAHLVVCQLGDVIANSRRLVHAAARSAVCLILFRRTGIQMLRVYA